MRWRASWCMAFKYADRTDFAPMMGRWMAHAGRELLADADALMPVPLHWRRLWARRFNQSAAAGRRNLRDQRRAGAARRAEARHAPRRSRSACPRRSGRTMCRARSACRTAREGARRRPSCRPDRRRADLRCNRRYVRSRAYCGAGPPMSTCWSSPGLSRGSAFPYKQDREPRAEQTMPMSISTPHAGVPIATAPKRC